VTYPFPTLYFRETLAREDNKQSWQLVRKITSKIYLQQILYFNFLGTGHSDGKGIFVRGVIVITNNLLLEIGFDKGSKREMLLIRDLRMAGPTDNINNGSIYYIGSSTSRT
jgi:hypothetical protein